MVFREIIFDSPEYALECALRDEVLRLPLKLSLWDEDLSSEKDQLHFGLFQSDGGLLACVLANPISSTEVKIRQVAVASIWQKMGLGRKLMIELEKNLRERGLIHLTLHARTTAAGFYERLGYTAIGEEFEQTSIPHIEMKKRLSGPGSRDPDAASDAGICLSDAHLLKTSDALWRRKSTEP